MHMHVPYCAKTALTSYTIEKAFIL